MITPHIHLNGTSADRLIEAAANAYDKLEEAYQALKETAPNGRDYYPLGDGAMKAAVEEHLDRLRKIDAVKDELQHIIDAIEDQRR